MGTDDSQSLLPTLREQEAEAANAKRDTLLAGGLILSLLGPATVCVGGSHAVIPKEALLLLNEAKKHKPQQKCSKQ